MLVGAGMTADAANAFAKEKLADACIENCQFTEDEDTSFVCEMAETNPMFPGGEQALMRYLSTNLRYPRKAQESGKEGRVLVQFIVDKDGSIIEPKVLRSVDPELDAEAVRVVKAMPKWEPGKKDGKVVRVKYTMPIMFRLSSGQQQGAPGQSAAGGHSFGGGRGMGQPRVAKSTFMAKDQHISWGNRMNVSTTGENLWKKTLRDRYAGRAAEFLRRAFAGYPEEQLQTDAIAVADDFAKSIEWRMHRVFAQNVEDYTKYVDLQFDEYIKWRAVSFKFSGGVAEIASMLTSVGYATEDTNLSDELEKVTVNICQQLVKEQTTRFLYEHKVIEDMYKTYIAHYATFDMARGLFPLIMKGNIDKEKMREYVAAGNKAELKSYINSKLEELQTSMFVLIQKNFMTWLLCNVPELNDATAKAVAPGPQEEKVFTGIVGLDYMKK